MSRMSIVALVIAVALAGGVVGGVLWTRHHTLQREKRIAEALVLQSEIETSRLLVDTGLVHALDLFRLHVGYYPTARDGGLRVLTVAPKDTYLADRWRGPYVKAANLKDAWGNDLIYVCPGKHNQRTYDLASIGPDGVEGTKDDIVNWD